MQHVLKSKRSYEPGTIQEMGVEHFDGTMRINVRGVYLVTHAAIQRLRDVHAIDDHAGTIRNGRRRCGVDLLCGRPDSQLPDGRHARTIAC